MKHEFNSIGLMLRSLLYGTKYINPFPVTEYFQSKNGLKKTSPGLKNFSFSISEIFQFVAEYDLLKIFSSWLKFFSWFLIQSRAEFFWTEYFRSPTEIFCHFSEIFSIYWKYSAGDWNNSVIDKMTTQNRERVKTSSIKSYRPFTFGPYFTAIKHRVSPGILIIFLIWIIFHPIIFWLPEHQDFSVILPKISYKLNLLQIS